MATVALYARQAADRLYHFKGILAGPAEFGLIRDTCFAQEIQHIGIMFLLFLLDFNLNPKKLLPTTVLHHRRI
jgi:predicted Kef-type K+ transport protein